MTEFVQTIVLGLLIGGSTPCWPSGLTLIFGVMSVINIAHGAFLILAAFVTYSLWTATGLDPLLSIAVHDADDVRVRLADLPRRRSSRSAAPTSSSSVLLTFALALVLEGAMGLIWGNTSHAVRPSYVDESFTIGEIFLPKAQVYGGALASSC